MDWAGYNRECGGLAAQVEDEVGSEPVLFVDGHGWVASVCRDGTGEGWLVNSPTPLEALRALAGQIKRSRQELRSSR